MSETQHATPPLRRLRNLWLLHRPRLRRALFPRPWPDFTEYEVELATGSMTALGRDGGERTTEEPFPWFPDLPPDHAIYHGWFESFGQYRTFAALVFAHRNRDHPYAEYARSENPQLTDRQIVALQKGWEWIDWEGGADAPTPERADRKLLRALPELFLFVLFYGSVLAGLFATGVEDASAFWEALPYGMALALPVRAGVWWHERRASRRSARGAKPPAGPPA
jgi:hypothetical protein